MTLASPTFGPGGPASAAERAPSQLRRPAFLVGAGILLLAGLFLTVAVSYLQLHFRKLPVPLRGNLTDLPAVMGHWVQVSRDEPVAHDLEETLGTNLYVFREYVHVAAMRKAPALLSGTRLGELFSSRLAGRSPQQLADEFSKLEPKERRELTEAIRIEQPAAVLSFAVTHYTGKADTVAHVPERCFLADGWNEVTKSDERFAAGGRTLDVRCITFENEEPTRVVRCNVSYFFQVNGGYTCDSLEVRRSLQNLLMKYGYYAKVELSTTVQDHVKAQESMKDFLSGAMPEIEKVLPNWAEYQGR